MIVGIQLYTLRTIINNQLEETFRQIKSMGYDGVELAGFYGKTANELKTLLNQQRLEVISAHESIERILENPKQVMDDYVLLGTKNIVIPYTDIHDKESYEAMLPKIKKAVTMLTDAGFTVHYHNHSNEFNQFDDKYIIEHLLNDIEDLHLELDIYWAKAAGVDIYAFIELYKDKIKQLHAKDMVIEEKQHRFASVGEGTIDFTRIHSLFNDCWIVENDKPINNPLDNIQNSINYINQLRGGQK